jgi:excisionase family DNA binding protein
MILRIPEVTRLKKANIKKQWTVATIVTTVTVMTIFFIPLQRKESEARIMKMKKSELRDLYSMMFPEYPDIVNITQLQSMLCISRHLAYELINEGYIKALKIGNAFRIPKVNVIEYVMEQSDPSL